MKISRPTLALAFFFVAVIWAYWPSLWHIARSDQVTYFANTSSKNAGVLQMILGYYDAPRHFVYAAGDQILFRPLFYALLGFERVFFGYRFWLWQLMGILLHLLCVWCLYRFLRAVRPGLTPAILAGGFGLLLLNIEAVIWQHVNAYILFAAVVLMAAERLYRFALATGNPRRLLYQAGGLMWAAVFLYENGVVYAFLFGLFLLAWSPLKDRWKNAGVFFLPAVAYVVASVSNFWLSPPVQSAQGAVLPQSFSFTKAVVTFLLTLKWHVLSGFFLTAADIRISQRLIVPESILGWAWPWPVMSVAMISGGMVLGAFLAGLFLFSRQRNDKALTGMMVLFSLMLLAQVAVVTCGRVIPKGLFLGLGINLYSLYNFWVLVLVIWYMVVDISRGKKTVVTRAILAIVCVVWLGHAAVNAYYIRRANEKIAMRFEPKRKLVEGLEQFMLQHRGEPGLSFRVTPDVPGNYLASWIIKSSDPDKRMLSFVEALYVPYWDVQHPKYTISRQPVRNGER